MSSTNPNRLITTHDFEEEKKRLFHEIQQQLEQLRTDPFVSSIQDKIERHNAIRDQEDEIIPTIGRDPLKKFPPEIWKEILHESATKATPKWKGVESIQPVDVSKYSDHPSRWNIDELIKLTNVSNLWQSAILSTPSFWANIRIDDSIDDLEAKVILCLHLSQDLPLRVGLQIPTPYWETLGPLFNAEGFRIRSIFLYGYDESDVNMERDFDLTLNWIKNLPSLHELGVDLGPDCTLYSPSLFEHLDSAVDKNSSEASISLTRLHGFGISSEILKQQILSGLQHINTGFTPRICDIFPVLFDLQHLRYFSTYDVDFSFDAEFPVSPAPEHLRGSTPDYRRLDPLIILSDGHRYLWETLKNLWLEIKWDSLDRLFAICPEMRNLETLSLTLKSSHLSIFASPTGKPWYIKALALDITPPALYWDNASSNERNAHRLFKALKTVAPYVEDLTIQNEKGKEQAIQYISSLKRLKRLSYSFPFPEWPLHIGVVTLPSVEYASIKSPDSNVLSYLDCPSILALSFDCDPRAIQNLNVSQWSSLRSLDVRGEKVEWRDVSLPLVKTVAFTCRWSLTSETSFCRELARKSTAFPSLECLRFRNFPDWDIFFVMLEERNLLNHHRVSPIRIVGFEVLPSPEIVRAISCRLDGHLSARPSNYELSILSHLDKHLDPDILGCNACHRAFISCYYAVRIISKRELVPQSIPSYPRTTKKLIEAHENLSDWILRTTADLRRPICARYREGNLHEITAMRLSPLSLSGTS